MLYALCLLPCAFEAAIAGKPLPTGNAGEVLCIPWRMAPKQPNHEQSGQGLTIDEVRLVSDLRIMHAKVDELYQIISKIKRHFDEAAICQYADAPVLAENIIKIDEIYLWFVKLKEERERERKRVNRF